MKTETPWKVDEEKSAVVWADNIRIEQTYVSDFLGLLRYSTTDEIQEIGKANSAFIVKACNNHQSLVDALQGIISRCEEAELLTATEPYFKAKQLLLTLEK